MLIEFAAKNYKSLKELTRFSMLSTLREELPSHTIALPGTNPKKSVNKLAVLFGPNASGKSNILSALLLMVRMVRILGISRADENRLQGSFYAPYAFTQEEEKEPTIFQVTYFVRSTYFRYGYSYDARQIHEEWLYSGKLGEEVPVFTRDSQRNVDLPNLSEEEREKFTQIQEHLTATNLFLAVGADLKDSLLSDAASFFNDFANSPPKDIPLTFFNKQMDKYLPVLGDLLSFADVGIVNVEKKVKKVEWQEMMKGAPEEVKPILNFFKNFQKSEKSEQEIVMFNHSSSDGENECLLPEKDESSGTRAYLRLVLLLCEAICNNGVLVIDELDENLHPLLIARIFQFFTSITSSTAQLICTSHAPIIFSPKVLRSDELWLTEKDMAGQTFITCAADYKDAGNNENFMRFYLEGRFGGVPLFNNKYMDSAISKVQEIASVNLEAHGE